MGSRRKLALWLSGTLVLGLAACDSTDPQPGTLQVESVGRAERGGTVTLRVTQDGVVLPAEGFTVETLPSGSAEVQPGVRVRLTQAGALRLTVRAGARTGSLELSVAVPPRLVVEVVESGNRNLRVVALDGGDNTALTTDPGDDRLPTSLGGTVVFAAVRGGQTDLYDVASTGGTERRLTNTADVERDPALGTGNRLAFTRPVGGVSKLFTAAADASGATRLTTALGFPGSVEASPSWSPDGSRLVFMATHAGSADLWTWSAADGFNALVSEGTPEVEPAWSPDGRRVAFASERAGRTDLYVVEVASGTVTRLTTGASGTATYARPAWLPDGRLAAVAFQGSTRTLVWLESDGASAPIAIPLGSAIPERSTALR